MIYHFTQSFIENKYFQKYKRDKISYSYREETS